MWPDDEKPGDGFGFSIAGSTHAAVIGSDGWDADTGAAWDSFALRPGIASAPDRSRSVTFSCRTPAAADRSTSFRGCA